MADIGGMLVQLIHIARQSMNLRRKPPDALNGLLHHGRAPPCFFLRGLSVERGIRRPFGNMRHGRVHVLDLTGGLFGGFVLLAGDTGSCGKLGNDSLKDLRLALGNSLRFTGGFGDGVMQRRNALTVVVFLGNIKDHVDITDMLARTVIQRNHHGFERAHARLMENHILDASQVALQSTVLCITDNSPPIGTLLAQQIPAGHTELLFRRRVDKGEIAIFIQRRQRIGQ